MLVLSSTDADPGEAGLRDTRSLDRLQRSFVTVRDLEDVGWASGDRLFPAPNHHVAAGYRHAEIVARRRGVANRRMLASAHGGGAVPHDTP
jgi:hypothetical protein